SLPPLIAPSEVSTAAVLPPGASYTYSYELDGYCPGVGWCWAGPSGPSAGNQPNFGDYNGDGKTDVFYWHMDGYFRYVFSTGVGTTGELIGPPCYGYDEWTVADWDGDGFDDAITAHAATGTWLVMRSNGLGFEAPVNTLVPFMGT